MTGRGATATTRAKADGVLRYAQGSDENGLVADRVGLSQHLEFHRSGARPRNQRHGRSGGGARAARGRSDFALGRHRARRTAARHGRYALSADWRQTNGNTRTKVSLYTLYYLGSICSRTSPISQRSGPWRPDRAGRQTLVISGGTGGAAHGDAHAVSDLDSQTQRGRATCATTRFTTGLFHTERAQPASPHLVHIDRIGETSPERVELAKRNALDQHGCAALRGRAQR